MLRMRFYLTRPQLNWGVGQQARFIIRQYMFDIEFVSDEPQLQDEEWYGLWGRVTLGEHSETFLALT